MSTSNHSECHTLANHTYNLNNFSHQNNNSSNYEKNERIDWDSIIFNLKLNGFNELPLKFDENDNLYFDGNGAITLRMTIFDLLSEYTKKQEMMKDYMNSNEKLKSQVKDDSFLIQRYEEMIKNLNDNVLASKQQIKEMTSSNKDNFYSNRNNNNKDHSYCDSVQANVSALEESRQIVVSRYHNLERICDEQREEINSLQLKLTKITALDKSRNQRQREIFHQLRNKAPNCYNALDKRLLDVIESYESRVLQLESHLTFFSNLGFSLPNDESPISAIENNNNNNNNNNSSFLQNQSHKSETTNEYKQLIKKLQEEIENIQKEKEIATEKYELMKLDSETKPSMLEMKDVLNKLREYKRLLEIHNIRPEKEKKLRKNNQNSPGKAFDYPNGINDIEFLPLKSCQKYLKDFCTYLNSKSVVEAFQNLSDLLKMNAFYPTYFGICSRLLQLIDTPGLPQFIYSRKLEFSESDNTENRYTQILDTVEIWVHQLCSVNQLLNSVEQLKSILLPWKTSSRNTRFGIHGAIDLVNEILYECQLESNIDSPVVLTAGHAKGLVEHFQNLFDCPQAIGVYSRMNVIYAKFSEMQNVIDSLKKILNIEDQKGFACLVAEVDALDQMVNSKCRKQTEQLELTKDIELLIEKVERYENFLPEFEGLVDDITNLMGLSSIDEILPRIKALQEFVRVNQ